MKSRLRYIDLFAGIGGFHIALDRLGHTCVFASEIKESLAKLYEQNFGIRPNRDITKIPIEDIPSHDILCAGFPCQPFSKAGSQKGLFDERNGSLFDRIVDILDYHRPKFFILENVRNLEKHNKGETWAYIQYRLKNELNYNIEKNVLSPHNFGIPQHRERFFIVGCRDGINHFHWPKSSISQNSIYNYLDKDPIDGIKLEPDKIYVLDLWQEFLDRLPKSAKIPSWPIWSMEFGATYTYESTTPFASSTRKIGYSNGCYGIPLKGMSREEKFANLPSYARTMELDFPRWKKNYIRNNRDFYNQYRRHIDPVVKKIRELNVPSWQKLEWNVQGGERIIRNYIIQFRGSGIRIKKTDFFPSLVTVTTQIPIIGREERYITPREGARLQSIDDIDLPDNVGSCFSALGNAVNVTIIEEIAKRLVYDE